MKKINIILPALAAGAVLWAVFWFLQLKPLPSSGPQPSLSDLANQPLQVDILRAPKETSEDQAVPAKSWRDPFNLAGKTDKPIIETKPGDRPAPPPIIKRLPKLQGIMEGAEGWEAFIDEVAVKVGDRVGPYEVKSISETSVVISQENETIVLHLD